MDLAGSGSGAELPGIKHNVHLIACVRRRFEPLRTPRGEFGYPVSADTELISAPGELRCGRAGPSLCLSCTADPGFAVFAGGKSRLPATILLK